MELALLNFAIALGSKDGGSAEGDSAFDWGDLQPIIINTVPQQRIF